MPTAAAYQKSSIKSNNRNRSRSSSIAVDVDSDQDQLVVKKPTSSRKRKVIEINASEAESSSVEIVETMPVTPIAKPKKICKKDMIVTALDEPVIITSKQSGVDTRHLARRLSFGSIDDQDVTAEPHIAAESGPSSMGKRVRKPSEKAIASKNLAKALDALDAEDSSDLPDTISPPKKAKKSGKTQSASKTPKKTGKPTIESDVDADHNKDEKVPSNKRATHQRSDDDTHERSNMLSTRTKGKRKAIPDSNHAPSDNDRNVAKKQSTPAEWPASDSNDGPVAPAEDVVEPSPGDAVHQETVEGDDEAMVDVEPEIPTCTLFNYRAQKKHVDGIDPGMGDADYNMRVNFAAVSSDLLPIVAKSLSRALGFKCFVPFINLARASPDETDVNSQNTLIIKGKSQLALSLITGCVTACDLITPAHNSSGAAIKRITILPFDDEYDTFINYLGLKFKRTALYGPVVKFTHLSIARRKQGAPTYASNSRDYMTPVWLNSKYLTQPKGQMGVSPSKSITTPGTWYTRQLPLSYEHDADVPIYDARALGFAFDKAAFDNLRHLPLYRKKGVKHPTTSDLPENAIVTIGHTINTFTDREASASAAKDQDLIVSFNLHFVILLGLLSA